MTLRRVPPAPPQQSEPTESKGFDPDSYNVVTEHQDVRGLLVGDEPEDFIWRFTTKLYARDPESEDELEQGALVATVRFSHVAFGAWGGDGESIKFDFADAVSGELLEIADALFDENGDTRNELDVSGVGIDLLHIEMIELVPGHDVFEVVRHLLEHILMRYEHGCFGAVYYQANWESIGVARPLKDRGFRQLRTQNRHIWFIDLGWKRPPLDGRVTETLAAGDE